MATTSEMTLKEVPSNFGTLIVPIEPRPAIGNVIGRNTPAPLSLTGVRRDIRSLLEDAATHSARPLTDIELRNIRETSAGVGLGTYGDWYISGSVVVCNGRGGAFTADHVRVRHGDFSFAGPVLEEAIGKPDAALLIEAPYYTVSGNTVLFIGTPTSVIDARMVLAKAPDFDQTASERMNSTPSMQFVLSTVHLMAGWGGRSADGAVAYAGPGYEAGVVLLRP